MTLECESEGLFRKLITYRKYFILQREFRAGRCRCQPRTKADSIASREGGRKDNETYCSGPCRIACFLLCHTVGAGYSANQRNGEGSKRCGVAGCGSNGDSD